MKNLKAILNSAALATIITFFPLISGWDNLWNIRFPILWCLLFIVGLIIFINNRPAQVYFWKFGYPDWVTTADIWICFLGSIIYALSAVLVWKYIGSGNILQYIGSVCLIPGALIFRYGYSRHAPEDFEEYLKDKKFEEDPDSLVVVAECNDSATAYIIKGMLESNGIDVVIFGDGLKDQVGVGAHTIPVRLLVRKRDKDMAEKLINE